MDDYLFTLDFKVRDSECDLQGIVNNSNYLVYLEHARHEFLLSRHMNFASLAAQGVLLVVTRIEVDYRKPLRSGDQFWVALNARRAGRTRFEFQQDIYLRHDRSLMLNARVVGCSMNAQGKPIRFPELDTLITTE